jgi:hypothetical protein
MIRAIYVSNFIDKLKQDYDAQVENILEVARSKNLDFNITGILKVNNNDFMQIIEGDVDPIEQLLNNISLDDRHKNFTIIYKENIKERLYADWTMAFKQVEENDLININKIYSWDDLITNAKSNVDISKNSIQDLVNFFILK